jgi:hypothetical protein
MARLLRAGWCAGEIRPGASPAGDWRVFAAREEHFLDVRGQTQAEAWHGAAELARGLDRGDQSREAAGPPEMASCPPTSSCRRPSAWAFLFPHSVADQTAGSGSPWWNPLCVTFDGGRDRQGARIGGHSPEEDCLCLPRCPYAPTPS